MNISPVFKRFFAALLCAVAVLTLSACAAKEDAIPSTQPSQTAAPSEPTTTQAPTTVPPTTVPPTITPPATVPPATQPPTTKPPAPRTGWYEEDGKRYYYDDNGVMLTGWLGLGEDWYYLKEDGSMAVGKTVIDGETCYFGPDGIQILLVNPWNYIPEGYSPQIVDINGWQYVDARCYDELMQMLDDCRAAGLIPYVASAYRTHNDQIFLHNRKIQRLIDEGYSEEDAKVLAGTVVAVPGTSEHELGLALDLVDNNYRNLDEAQEHTAVQKWLMENSWRYGFILRYPNEKSAITGIIYEPWHYRYVGKTVAREIYDSGLCLEEYLEALGNG